MGSGEEMGWGGYVPLSEGCLNTGVDGKWDWYCDLDGIFSPRLCT